MGALICYASPVLAPIYDLPSFASYDAGTDTVWSPGFDTGYLDTTGWTTLTVTNSGNRATNKAALQAAIDTAAASSGNTLIKVKAGGDYGDVDLKARPGAPEMVGWIYIRPDDAAYASVPAPSTGMVSGGAANRVRPTDVANLWMLTPGSSSDPALATVQPGVANICKYRIVGCYVDCSGIDNVTEGVRICDEFGQWDSFLRGVGYETGSNLTAASQMPSFIYFDRCLARAKTNKTTTVTSAVFRMAANDWAMLDCYWYELGCRNENKWILALEGERVKVTNSYLEGGVITILLGGSTPSFKLSSGGTIKQLPQDWLFDRLHLNRRNAWNPFHPDYTTDVGLPKNNFEIKFGKRVVLQDSCLDGMYVGGQSYIINIKTEATYDDVTPQTTWATTRDLTMRHLHVAGFPNGVTLVGHTVPDDPGLIDDYEAQRTTRVDLHNVVLAGGNAVDYAAAVTDRSALLNINCIGEHRVARLTAIAPTSGAAIYHVVFDDRGNPDDLQGPGRYADWVLASDFSQTETSQIQKVILNNVFFSTNGGASSLNAASRGGWSATGICGLVTQDYSAAQAADFAAMNTSGPAAVLVESGVVADVVTTLSASAPRSGDYTIVHPSMLTAGTSRRLPGADWAGLSARLAGVREAVV